MRGSKSKAGLRRYDFRDTSGTACSVQEAGPASPEEAALWFGPHPRMLLSRDLLLELMPYFVYFLEHGGLPEPLPEGVGKAHV